MPIPSETAMFAVSTAWNSSIYSANSTIPASTQEITAPVATAPKPDQLPQQKEMARLAGFEPTTSAFAGLRSIR